MAYFAKGTYTSFNGSGGDDLIEGTDGSDVMAGNAGNDEMYGRQGDDFLLGNAGDDMLYGNRGNDVLLGGNGNDYMNGGNNNDLLDGDFGRDTYEGGNGNDVFFFSARTAGQVTKGVYNATTGSDRILDFTSMDTIKFGGYDSSVTKLIFAQSGSNTTISVDLNGDGSFVYLAVTVLDTLVAAVEANTVFGDFEL